jgi:hypothetical protein
MENKISIKKNIEYITQLEGDKFEFNEIEIENEYLKVKNDKSSIAIKILSVLGGFLATLAFLGFLLIAGLYDSEVGLVITGVIFLAVALWLNIVHNKLIIDTLSVSAYAIGLCLFAFGLSELEFGDNTICFLLMLIALLTIGITKNYILSFISTLTINGSFIFLIVENDLYNLIHIYNAILLVLLTYVFLNEAKLLADNRFLSKLYNPIRMGLVFSLLIGLVFVGQRGIFDFEIKYVWASSIITIPLTLYVISIITKIIGVTKTNSLYLIYALCLLFLIPTTMSPAISGTLLIILLCFLVNYKTGLTIGVLSFVYFISQYYYDLNYTLLTKSIILFLSGIVFLLFYVFTHKKLGHNEKV